MQNRSLRTRAADAAHPPTKNLLLKESLPRLAGLLPTGDREKIASATAPLDAGFLFGAIPVHAPRQPRIQPKLTVGANHDPCEQEADRIAEDVVGMPVPQVHGGELPQGSAANVTQPIAGHLQARPLGPSSTAQTAALPIIVNEVLDSPGQPLDAQTRAYMEPRFGHDFSQVRIHSDKQAAGSARAMNALAYTVGRDVVMGAEKFAPTTTSGRRLLAHELTHVLQQTNPLSREHSAVVQRDPVATLAKIYAPQKAVEALRPNAKGFDVSHLSVDLLLGIARAESGVLKDRWIESARVGDTQGPGQLGANEINEADSTFVTARKVFADTYGEPPETWQAKTNDPNWAYFYIAASYLLKLAVAQKNFQPREDLMSKENAAGTKISDAAIGIHELGLVTYHGGFDRMAAYRRRIAGDPQGPSAATHPELAFRERFGIAAGFKRWQVTNEMALAAIREGLFMSDAEDQERLGEMETYLQNVAGGFDFAFDVAIYLEASRRFFVSGGTVEILSSAYFPEGLPGTPSAEYEYYIQLYSDSSDLLASRHDYATAMFKVGESQIYRWTNLPSGHYRFAVHKRSGPILHGDGKVKFK